MPRDGSLTPADLLGRIQTISVECLKCDRRGRYNVRTLVREVGLDGKLTDWLSRLSADCPRKDAHSFTDRCDVRCPGLTKLFGRGQPCCGYADMTSGTQWVESNRSIGDRESFF